MINLVAGNYVRGRLLYLPPVFTGEKIEAQEAGDLPEATTPQQMGQLVTIASFIQSQPEDMWKVRQ